MQVKSHRNVALHFRAKRPPDPCKINGLHYARHCELLKTGLTGRIVERPDATPKLHRVIDAVCVN